MDQVDQRTCLQNKALSVVRNNHPAKEQSIEVAKFCEAIPKEHIRWRWECHFKSAEAFLSKDSENYAVAVDHCLVANEYSGRCVMILNKILAKKSPPADALSASWNVTLDHARLITSTWSPYNEKLKNEVLDSFWGFALLHSYRIATKITGDPFDSLGVEVIPHIHAAAAYELLTRSASVKEFSTLLVELELALKVRDARSSYVREPYVAPTINDWWSQDEANDVDIVAISYLGKSRRTFSDAPRLDLSICILEAAARLDTEWLSLIKSQRDSSDESLQWTVKRLLKNHR